MDTTADTKQLTRTVPADIATERNLDLIDEVFAEDFVDHGPFGQDIRGPDGVREWMASFTEAFPDFEATIDELIAEDGLSAMRVTLRGTHEGPFMGFEPSGDRFEIQNMVFTRVEDGKIVERWTLPDTLSMLQQLGVLPPMDELEGTAPPP